MCSSITIQLYSYTATHTCIFRTKSTEVDKRNNIGFQLLNQSHITNDIVWTTNQNLSILILRSIYLLLVTKIHHNTFLTYNLSHLQSICMHTPLFIHENHINHKYWYLICWLDLNEYLRVVASVVSASNQSSTSNANSIFTLLDRLCCPRQYIVHINGILSVFVTKNLSTLNRNLQRK